MKHYKSDNHAWFVLVGDGLDKVNRGGTHSFRGYHDHANAHGRGVGAYVEYVVSRDANGQEKGKQFVLDESRRRWQVRVGERDASKTPISQYDFLKFSPDCEGSPNGYYQDAGDGVKIQQGVMFREMNDDRDAEVALEADLLRVDAQGSALKLDEGTLSEIAVFIGVFRNPKLQEGEPDKLMRFKVVEYAGKKPVDYFKLLNSGDRAVRAIVRKSVQEGILTQKGSIIFWESTMLGADEDAAISTILSEPRMLEALQSKVDLGTTVEAKKNKGGRPPKNKDAKDKT